MPGLMCINVACNHLSKSYNAHLTKMKNLTVAWVNKSLVRIQCGTSVALVSNATNLFLWSSPQTVMREMDLLTIYTEVKALLLSSIAQPSGR